MLEYCIFLCGWDSRGEIGICVVIFGISWLNRDLRGYFGIPVVKPESAWLFQDLAG